MKKSEFEKIPVKLQNFLIDLDGFVSAKKIEGNGALQIELILIRGGITSFKLTGFGHVFTFQPGELKALKEIGLIA